MTRILAFTSANRPTHCVVYRMGGKINFKWHRSVAMTKLEAQRTAESVRNAGRAAYVADFDMAVAIGLPETYDAATQLVG